MPIGEHSLASGWNLLLTVDIDGFYYLSKKFQNGKVDQFATVISGFHGFGTKKY